MEPVGVPVPDDSIEPRLLCPIRAAAIALANAVQTVIYAQTNKTIDIVGLDKMVTQRKALEAFRKAVKP